MVGVSVEIDNMTLGEEMSAFLELEMEPALGNLLFNWNGAEYPCSVSTEEIGTEMVVGGKIYTIRLTLFVRKNVLPTPITVDSTIITVDSTTLTADNETAPPRSGRKLQRNNRSYRIISVTTDPERLAFYRLTLADPVSNR